jgi:hypothetical protein
MYSYKQFGMENSNFKHPLAFSSRVFLLSLHPHTQALLPPEGFSEIVYLDSLVASSPSTSIFRPLQQSVENPHIFKSRSDVSETLHEGLSTFIVDSSTKYCVARQ